MLIPVVACTPTKVGGFQLMSGKLWEQVKLMHKTQMDNTSAGFQQIWSWLTVLGSARIGAIFTATVVGYNQPMGY